MHVLLAAWFANHWADVGTIVSIVIAFAAAFRPELHSLLRPRRVDILLTDSYFLEIGFIPIGPTFGIVGTLNNRHARSLINKLRVRLTVPGSGEELILSPVYNRQRAIDSTSATGEQMRGTLWLPFLIDEDTAVPFDVLFRSDAANASLTSIGITLTSSWLAYANQQVETNEGSLRDPDPNVQQANVAAFVTKLYNESAELDFIVKARRAIAETFAWAPGTYEGRFEVEVMNDSNTFARRFRFEFSEDQCRQIRANIDTIVAISCGQLGADAPFVSAISSIAILD